MAKFKNISIWMNYILMSMISIVIYAINHRQFSHSIEYERSSPGSSPLDQQKIGEIWSCVLYNSGGRILPPIKFNHEWQRLIISSFLHRSVSHLFSNTLYHFLFLHSIIEHYSVWEILFSSYYSILAGNTVSAVYQPNQISVGGSCMVFSILGMMVVQTATVWYFSSGEASDHHRGHRKTNLIKLAVALVFVALGVSPGNDIYNHAYGFLTGVILGLLKVVGFLKNNEKDEARERRLGKVVVVVKVLMAAIPLGHLSWILGFYGKDEDHAAAILNMGCDS